MKKCLIKAGNGYEVTVGSNLAEELIGYLKSVGFDGKIAIVSDSNVAKLYMANLRKVLIDGKYSVATMEFPAGEENKTLKTYEMIMHFLLLNEIGRNDMLIALGGGVTGDLAGFAAATYMRGIRYIMMPTTLLSMVDSSVGGKTAVDMQEGKNLVGAFHQPVAVFADTDYLKTLDENILMQGMVEAIKAGVIGGKDLLDLISRYLDTRGGNILEDIILKSIEIKGKYVSEDEFDCGRRKILNLGHTLGHAIERCTGYMISHGEAVAIGLNKMVDESEKRGELPAEEGTLIRNILIKTGLRQDIPGNISLKSLMDAILLDKKTYNDKIDIIMIRRIGDCYIKQIAVDDFYSYIE